MPKKKIEEKGLNFTPARGKYLVLVNPEQTVTDGGILIPDNGKEKPMEGVIKAVGSEKHTEFGNFPLDYHVNDVILFGKYSGQEITLDNILYLILDESDVLGNRY